MKLYVTCAMCPANITAATPEELKRKGWGLVDDTKYKILGRKTTVYLCPNCLYEYRNTVSKQ